jgi:hypothetical protein
VNTESVWDTPPGCEPIRVGNAGEQLEMIPSPHQDILRDILEINKMAMALNVEIFKALQPPLYVIKKESK